MVSLMSNYPDGMTTQDWEHLEGAEEWTCATEYCDNPAPTDDSCCDECVDSMAGDVRYDRMRDEGF